MQAGSGKYAPGGRAGWIRLSIAVGLILVLEFVAQYASAQGAIPVKAQPRLMPPFDHIVIVIEENKGYDDILNKKSDGEHYDAPYLNELAQEGASFTNAHGEWHPSQPNYLELFSGLQQTIVDDNCVKPFSINAPDLASELQQNRLTFKGYAEDLPADLSKCYRYLKPGKDGKPAKDPDPNRDKGWVATTMTASQDTYVSKHVPWLNFTNPPPSLPWTSNLAGRQDYGFLPKVAMVIPNDWHNMHPTKDNHPKPPENTKPQEIQCGDGKPLPMSAVDQPASVRCGDDWLKKNMSAYAAWARNHNSLLIVTWDEDSSTEQCKEVGTGVCQMKYPDGSHIGTTPENNRIPTIFVGARVKVGQYAEWINHYNVLRTLEDMYRLKGLGVSASVQPITDVWQ
jgi:hypothetical protein